MTSPIARAVDRYVFAITLAGLGLCIALTATSDTRGMTSGRYVLFAMLVLAGELLPIKVHRKGEQDEIITSTTFTFALVLTAGPALAALAQVTASLVADFVHRKPLWKAGFNAGQYTLSITAASIVLAVMTTFPAASFRVGPKTLPAVLLSGAVFFVMNNVVTATGLALAQGANVVTYLRQDLAFQGLTDGVLLALAPVVAVAADRTLWLVPLLIFPLTAVYNSARVSLENVDLVGKLEESLADLTELNRRNEHQALHDALTGLPNRTLFRDRVHQAVLTARRETATTGVMIIDLDRFKEINDTLGHHNGDVLLQQVGPRLRAMLRESDTVARLGGDEFAVLLPHVESDRHAASVASRIQRALAQPFQVGELMLDVEASVGIALFPEHGEDVDVLLQRADLAMYVAKSNRLGTQVYTPKYDKHSPSRLALLGELRRAIDDQQLVLHYQPKADLRTSEVVSVEALIRWAHPRRGLVPPGEFIPFAEHTTLIRPLTMYALDAALAQSRAWREMGVKLSVSVNLSVRNLLDLGLPEEVGRLLRKWELPSNSLDLEITESVLMAEPTRSMRVLNQLSEMGVGLSLDDFGTGYSSLAYLRQLPVDEIKIDRSFVMNMLREESDAMIVRSTIDLGKNLGLRVVAEGVEDRTTWDQLAALGCDVAQGYFLSRPIPSSELVRWWQQRASRRTMPAVANGTRLVRAAVNGRSAPANARPAAANGRTPPAPNGAPGAPRQAVTGGASQRPARREARPPVGTRAAANGNGDGAPAAENGAARRPTSVASGEATAPVAPPVRTPSIPAPQR